MLLPQRLRRLSYFCLTLAAITSVFASPELANAQPVFDVLHTFGGVEPPSVPRNLVQAVDGHFYGISSYRGSAAIARLTSAGRISIMHLLTAAEGTEVTALLPVSDGTFYGTTRDGGTAGVGTIFRMASDGAFTILHHFTGRTYRTNPGTDDGAYPKALLLASDGNFYGVTSNGGTSGSGAFFRMTPAAVVSVVYSFTDVGNPSTLMQTADGNFYGGGDYRLFKLTPAGTITVINTGSLTGTTASDYSPSTLIEGTDGNLYGTTAGTCPMGRFCGPGTAIKLTPAGQVTVLHQFVTTGRPNAPLLQVGSVFYGTTESVTFKMTSAGEVTALHTFTGSAEDGSGPSRLLRAGDGNLYGTTGTGGNLALGTMYRLEAADAFTRIATSWVDGPAGGAVPRAALLQGPDGSFYGTSSGGGQFGMGTIFKVTNNTTVSILHEFAGGSDGAGPYAPLILATDGNFYGTTYYGGGSANAGTIFQMTAAGVVTIVHRFTGGAEGSHPYAPVIQAADGALYGTTFGYCRLANCSGEAPGAGGTIFRMPLGGTLTTVRQLDGNVEGSTPYAGLVQATDGNFYGSTTGGLISTLGTTFNYYGTLFRMTPAGVVTVLYAFRLSADGAFPYGALLQSSDGNFYGATTLGGSRYGGTIFRLTPNGVFTLLYGLDTSTEAGGIDAPLIEGVDGNLYGVSRRGAGNGTVASGSILQITRAGVVTVLHAFTSGTGGAGPLGGLIQATNGALYGTTISSTPGSGTVFRLDISPRAPQLTLPPANTSVLAGQAAVFGVAATGYPWPGFQWQVSTNGGASWSNLANSSPYSGVTSATLVVSSSTGALSGYQFRCVAANAAGTVTSGAATLTVTSVNASPSPLRFGVTKGGGATFASATPAQQVAVSFTGSTPNAGWSAAANQPWVQITAGSGAGAGRFTVSVINPNDVIGASTSLSATITVATSISGVTTTVPVFLSVQQPGTSAAPFGAFDTPASGATGLSGSLAVTGWALDDLGIDRVEIWRDRAAGETTPVYPGSGPGNGKIFIANALFISGARPDVEVAYGSAPFAHRAGWGYLLLTQGLWNQGNGSFTLHAFAYDEEGHAVSLGSKTITVNNAAATKPFGALDTPGYGETVTAGFWNFGWALTPNASPTCTIPANGVQVSIDSGPLQPVNYGDNRPDIAAAFPGLSNGAGAGGAYYIDLTTLTNGTHQIGWLVTDSCGRAEGIGSRFFTVLTASSTVPLAARPTTTAADAVREIIDQPVIVRRALEAVPVEAAADGDHLVTIRQDERIEVELPAAGGEPYVGYQITNGIRRALPAGSSFDGATGVFYWQPAAGFLGTFDLEFVAATGGVVRVQVSVQGS